MQLAVMPLAGARSAPGLPFAMGPRQGFQG